HLARGDVDFLQHTVVDPPVFGTADPAEISRGLDVGRNQHRSGRGHRRLVEIHPARIELPTRGDSGDLFVRGVGHRDVAVAEASGTLAVVPGQHGFALVLLPTEVVVAPVAVVFPCGLYPDGFTIGVDDHPTGE